MEALVYILERLINKVFGNLDFINSVEMELKEAWHIKGLKWNSITLMALDVLKIKINKVMEGVN